MLEGELRLIEWNIAGAKYLALRSENSSEYPKPEPSKTREYFRAQLADALEDLIGHHSPDVVALQEVVRYDADGHADDASEVIDCPPGYSYYPVWLIDTHHYSAIGKWKKVRESGEWSENAFFAQGNATLVRDGVPYFPIFALPALTVQPDEGRARHEVIKLESGFYFGNRNTEPRAAVVTHLVLSELRSHEPDNPRTSLRRPLDVFIVNLHLTTLMREREGVPDIDEEAAQTRLRQLNILTNGIVSRYNRWRKEGYKIRDERVVPRENESDDRHPPIWVLAGDFNFTPESVEYATLVRRGFIDLMPNHVVGTKTSGLGRMPTLTVDYVFAGPLFEAVDPKVVSSGIATNRVEVTDATRISDHFPLIVSLPIALPED